MKWLHGKTEFTPEMMKEKPARELLNELNRVLKNAISSDIQQEIPTELNNYLKDDVFVFSGFKTYNELKEASLLLTDENGGIKPFDKFKQDVHKIDATYNERYLEAEYNFATGSAQMAAKWADIEADGDDYDLQYRTALDGKVRDEHATLHGTTLPPSDPFWDSYYPPNGWNCRCTVVPVRKGKYKQSNSQEAIQAGEKATTKIDKNGNNKAAMFRFNPGKQKVIFPPTHPYRSQRCTNCSQRSNLNNDRQSNIERCQACKTIKEIHGTNPKQLRAWAKENLVGKEVVHSGFEKSIRITAKGVKEYLNQPFEAYFEKNEAIKNMESILQNAQYKGFSHYHKENQSILYSHIFETEAIGGIKSWIIVRESINGEAIFHSISDNKKVLKNIKRK